MVNDNNFSIEKNETNMIYNINPSLKINYNIILKTEYEKNNLIYTKKIPKPNLEKIKDLLQKLDQNYIDLFNNMTNKIVDEKIIYVRKIYGDGNCYYRSLSFFFINNQTYHLYFRNYIYNFIADHEEEITKDYPFINVEDNLIPMSEYIKKINTENFYAGEIELLMTSKIFNINIIVLEYIREYKGYIQRTKIEIKEQKLSPILVLEYIENNKLGHYNTFLDIK